MRIKTAPILIVFCGLLAGCAAAAPVPSATSHTSTTASRGYIVMPDSTNSVQIRFYTNASPDAANLFNTFDVEAYGETLLQSPRIEFLHEARNASARTELHNVLINGHPPFLSPTNGMTIIERASGSEWKYVSLDGTAAYSDRLEQYRRGILFVEPNLIVVWDHLVAKEPIDFKMLLHPPTGSYVDADWRDLRLELPRAGIQITAPPARGKPRDWELIKSESDTFLPSTVTMQLGPTNKLAALDVLTTLVIHHHGEKLDVATRLLESYTAVGARIYRNGYPTLVAFKTDTNAPSASITGFSFTGPVGVDIFNPKPKSSP